MTHATSHHDPFRLGTRGSPLALAQASNARQRLEAALGRAVELVVMTSSGDRIQDRPLRDIGGKGLFTKELEEGLLEGRLDAAVHSMKDMETRLPDGLGVVAVLEREDPRDRLIGADSLTGLPAGARVGTSSLRRAAQVRRVRPDLAIVPFRGNVATRLAKLERGEADVTILAAAGLNRLGQGSLGVAIPEAQMLPAAAQGAVALEMALGHADWDAVHAGLDHPPTAVCVAAERALLAALDGSCRTAIGAQARVTGIGLSLTGEILSPDGDRAWRDERSGPLDTPEALGTALGHALREAAAILFPT